MINIHIRSNIADGFGAPVAELFRIINLIDQHPDEEIIIDFSRCNFLRPFLLVTLFALQRKLSSQKDRVKFNIEGGVAVYEYLNHIYFLQNGFIPDSVQLDEYDLIMNAYEQKSYIPLINFPARKTESPTQVRDRFIGVLGKILRRQIHAVGQMHSALTYLIDESVNNISDHAADDRGFVLAQNYPTKGYLELCIVDTGQSIKGSYQSIGRADVIDDKVAMQLALKGVSTKNEVTGRGFGIRTSRNMLVNGLGGKYLLISGNVAFIHSAETERIIVNPVHWQGTVVYMRIPVAAGKDFNYIDYIEQG